MRISDWSSDVCSSDLYFGGAGLAHMREFGTRLETFAMVRAKASRHAVHNPKALFRTELSIEDVMESPMLWPGVMTRLMACPPTCGAAAAIITSKEFARKNGLDSTAESRVGKAGGSTGRSRRLPDNKKKKTRDIQQRT